MRNLHPTVTAEEASKATTQEPTKEAQISETKFDESSDQNDPNVWTGTLENSEYITSVEIYTKDSIVEIKVIWK